MKHTYIIVDDSEKTELETRMLMQCFPDFLHVQSAFNFDDALNSILKYKPQIVFLEISPENAASKLSLYLISEVRRFLSVIPKFIITTKNPVLAIDSISYNVFDYLIKPLNENALRKSLLIFEKSLGRELVEDFSEFGSNADSKDLPIVTSEELDDQKIDDSIVDGDEDLIVGYNRPSIDSSSPLVVCIKSYGDHKYIEASSIYYLKADNNSTDIYLSNGEVVTAFKTLKTFEISLPFPFIRIHNSFIVNSIYVTRVHIGNSFCYIRDTTVKIPFSKSYKNNIENLLNYFENGNYVEF